MLLVAMSLIDSQSSSYCAHSADVKIHLVLDGLLLPVAQLGPGFLLLDTPADHTPGEGSIVLRVDQSERTWSVWLPNGISSKSKRVTVVSSR
jgi:hypothetical protein